MLVPGAGYLEGVSGCMEARIGRKVLVKDIAFIWGGGFTGSYDIIKSKINIKISHMKLLIINCFGLFKWPFLIGHFKKKTDDRQN